MFNESGTENADDRVFFPKDKLWPFLRVTEPIIKLPLTLKSFTQLKVN